MAQKETMMGSMAPMEKPAGKRGWLPVVLSIALIIAIGAAGYLYWEVMQLKKNPQQASQKEVQELVAKVSKLIVLPEGETPTIATVSDPEKLKDQAFFAKAQKGDKVLIYTNAKKAILYSPSTNKIVEVAPINIGSQAPSAAEK